MRDQRDFDNEFDESNPLEMTKLKDGADEDVHEELQMLQDKPLNFFRKNAYLIVSSYPSLSINANY
jgi:hypothetical protein